MRGRRVFGLLGYSHFEGSVAMLWHESWLVPRMDLGSIVVIVSVGLGIVLTASMLRVLMKNDGRDTAKDRNRVEERLRTLGPE